MVQSNVNSYEKGEMVPGPGTYHCTGPGHEVWTTDQANVRFPPCDICKAGGCRWVADDSTDLSPGA